MTPDLHKLWVYLAATPLLGLTATLVAYVFAYGIYQRLRFNPLANPVLIAVAILATLLTATGTPYKTYFDGAQFVHFLLGRPRWRWRCRCTTSGPSCGAMPFRY